MILDKSDKHYQPDKFSEKCGMRMTEIGDDYACAEMTIDETCLNSLGIPHGGLYVALADFAFGGSTHYIDSGNVTIEAASSFIASAKVGDTITATCRDVASSKHIARHVAEVRDQDGKLLNVVRFTGYQR